MKRVLLAVCLGALACGGGNPPDDTQNPPDSGTPVGTAVPGSPTAVTATPQSQQALVSWSAPSDTGGGIASYTITSSPAGSLRTVEGSVTSTWMPDLVNGTAYTFRVVATNSLGSSAPSGASPAITPLGLPGTPHDLIATRGNGSVTLSFTPPSDTGGEPITGYVATANPGG